MLKVVDKQLILLFKQVVIVETKASSKERTFAIYSHHFLLSGFSFANIYYSQQEKGKAISLTSLYHFYHFRDT